jgi:hypothetical protein
LFQEVTVGLILGNQQKKVSTLTESRGKVMISSTEAEKTFDQNPTFTQDKVKALNKLSIKGNFLNLIKTVYKVTMANRR